jgi:hypothetical protein
VVLAAAGLAWALDRLIGPAAGPLRRTVVLATLVPFTWLLARPEDELVHRWHRYLLGVQAFIDAGQWIDDNTPAETRVLAAWGHVAYESRRYVYDSSFLNRPPERVNLRVEYEPEVFVQTTRDLAKHEAPPGYRIVKTFTAERGVRKELITSVVQLRSDLLLPEMRARRESARSLRALAERLVSGAELAPEEITPERLAELERLAARLRAKADYAGDERAAEWSAELAARLDELRAGGAE